MNEKSVSVGYSNKKNKEWISDKVGKVILIISIVILVFMWGLFGYSIYESHSGENYGSRCLDAISQIGIESGQYTCLKSNGDISIQLSRGPVNFILKKIKYFAYLNGEVYQGEFLAENLHANEYKAYTLSDVDFSGISKLEIAPIIEMGNVDKVCDVTATVNLGACENE
tara:strand:- start:2867 stop:3373 length:507 start_codon:yes stop_codon:yes gene_type:complete